MQKIIETKLDTDASAFRRNWSEIRKHMQIEYDLGKPTTLEK